MFLRLTDKQNNLQLINCNCIDAIYLDNVKGQSVTKVCLTSCCYLLVQETVSEISLLLQAANKVIK